MDEEVFFRPARSAGLAFQAAAIVALIGASAWGLWRALNTQLGPQFLLYLIPSLLAVLLIPMLAYRAYSLMNAFYALSRDGIRLHWGLRSETIPVDQTLWIRRADRISAGERLQPEEPEQEVVRLTAERAGEASHVKPQGAPDREPRLRPTDGKLSLPSPWLRWPGGLLGQRRLPDGEPFYGAMIEYMADRARGLVLIGTPGVIYAISPANVEGFLETYARFSELGSTTPLPARSVYPTILIARVWRARLARSILLVGFVLNLALLAWVSLVIPAREFIILGFMDTAQPVPAIRLMMLPLLSSFFFLVDLFLGLYFFRMERRSSGGAGAETPGDIKTTSPVGFVPNGPILAYLLWISNVLTTVFFYVAVFYILTES